MDIVSKLKDPRLGFITLTDIEITPDFKIAKIYFSTMMESERALTTQILNKASNFIKKELFHRLDIKKIPDIKFIYDETPQKATRILKALDRLSEESEKT